MSAPIKTGRLSMTWLYNYFLALQANLWLVPAGYCLFFFAATAGLYTAEMAYPDILHGPVQLFQGEAGDAKSVVATLLSAMITMATLAISITIVVLSLAGSQLGPRLIKSVMSDRRTKDFIGMFFGAIVVCFVLTVILHSRQPDQPVPQTTIAFVFLVVFVNLFVLLGFVHHIAQSCIADSVITRVSNELKQTIDRLAEEQEDDRPADDEEDAGSTLPLDFETSGTALTLPVSGYIQQIDYKVIVACAARQDATVRIDVCAGYYVIAGERVGWIHHEREGGGGPDAEDAAEIATEIAAAFTVDNARTPTQDIEYSVRHMVEIALRALSPGINDTYTAIQVIDHLSAAMVAMFRKRVPAAEQLDAEGTLRLVAQRTSTAQAAFNAYDRIRHASCGKPDVARHLLEKLNVLAGFAREENTRAVLKDQVEALAVDLDCCSGRIVDREAIKTLAEKTVETLRDNHRA